MPPHSDDHRVNSIVPDSSDRAVHRGSARHATPSPASPGRRSPRVWPLWLLILCLIAALVGGSWYYLQAQRMQDARLDRFDQRLESTGSTLDASGESLRAEFDRLQDQLEATRAAVGSLETRVADSQDDASLDARLQALEESDDNTRALIGALQASYAALESTGQSERAALASRLDSIEHARQRDGERLEALSQTLDEAREQREALAARLETANTQRAQLEARLDELGGGDAANVDQLSQRVDNLVSQVNSLSEQASPSQESVDRLRDAVTELRQGQTALNAGMESLQSRLDALPSGVSESQLREIRERVGSLEASRSQLTRRVTSLITDVSNLQRGGG
ncbi:hypothetical protein [Salinicola avicenniae]|uniref:hypothetical protein n=1 Tax=Salinicola avicenniae TaxID=2916836 RepID=UPI0020745A36|nr:MULTISPECIES: hypothetical protein [unclassified Salinicola]